MKASQQKGREESFNLFPLDFFVYYNQKCIFSSGVLASASSGQPKSSSHSFYCFACLWGLSEWKWDFFFHFKSMTSGRLGACIIEHVLGFTGGIELIE